MIYFTSDLHFGHANIIHLTNRPFFSIEEMNETLIKNWNATVQPNDTVYILGDLAFKIPVKTANNLIKQLNGKKVLIKGNHDKDYDEKLFEGVYEYLEIPYNNHRFVLFHYPMEEWNGFFRSVYHLHGHQHNGPLYNQLMKNEGKKNMM